MPSINGARAAAVAALYEFEHGGVYSDAVIKKTLATAELDGRDAALASRIFYGVLENREYIDYQLAAYSTVRLKKVHPRVLAILRAGTYQLLFSDKLPHSAVVNESVKITRTTGNAEASGFVNAVLRKLAAEGAVEIVAQGDQYLSVCYSHPLWLVREFRKRLSKEETIQLLTADNSAPPVCIRANALKADMDHLCAALEEQGVTVSRDPDMEDCATLSDTGRIDTLPAYLQGLFSVQDKASQYCVLAGGPKPGMKVIDLCAAPGGKTMHAAALMENKGKILAFDIHPHKIKLLKNNAERLGVSIVECGLSDATVYRPGLADSADLVYADVPCSGLGIIRKKPDIRYKDPTAFDAFFPLSTAIIGNAGRYVKPGGRLIYSTCTLRKEENECIIQKFTETNSGFSPCDFTLPGNVSSENGMVTLWPHIHGTDGFFICVLRKGE